MESTGKADSAQTAKKYEREATLLRERIEELEPLLTETQQERFQLQRQSEQQRQERSELLLRVFKDVNRFLGTDVSGVSACDPSPCRRGSCGGLGSYLPEMRIRLLTRPRRTTRRRPTLQYSAIRCYLDCARSMASARTLKNESRTPRGRSNSE
jgi:hypothetical protein